MLFSEIASASRSVSATRSRLAKIEILTGLLARLQPDETAPAVAFLSGSLRQGRIGVGPAAAAAAAGVAHAGTPTLSILDVDRTLTRVASLSGPGSASARTDALAELFGAATDEEAHYLAGLLVGEVRQGALEGIMEEALARASRVPLAELRRALMVASDLPAVAETALVQGATGLERFHLELFRPIQPMLAQTAEDVGDAIERLGEAGLEYKLDGARVQVHRSGDDVRVYSRLGNDVTVAVPEIVEAVRALPVRTVVLDGEALALREDGAPHTFQTTMRRFGRRLDIERMRRELPIRTFLFDLLYHDGEDLIGRPARQRLGRLTEVARPLVVPRIVTADAGAASAFLNEALERGHEGLVAKGLETLYEAGSRGVGWLKIKPAHTLDLVVLAAEWGHGRRQGRLSNLHLGARDPASGAFVMIGKTFKGMTDAMLEWQTRRFQELAIGEGGHVVHVRPEVVVEIAFGDVQESPRYPGGVALRFARVKRYREDKRPEEADTIETVRAILAGERGKGTRG